MVGVPNFCGDYHYLITSTPAGGNSPLSATELFFEATTGLIYLYTENNAAVGTHMATVSVGLISYPTIPQATASFSISIEMC
jgi:hypothetical protein